MAYPSGSGSEILRRGAIHAQAGGNTTAFTWDGTSPTMGTDTYTVPTNHIITLLTIVVTDQTNTNKWFNLFAYTSSSGSGAEIFFLNNQNVTADSTYVWDERIVLHPTDKLYIDGQGSANFDVFYTYLDQNWE